jgi:flagellin
MRLNHNLASLNVYRSYIKGLKKQSIAMERISTGNKINRAGENPNGIAQSERCRLQIRSLQMASKNVQDGISMLQTAEGGMMGINESLQKIRKLIVQGGGANSDSDKEIIQKEINQMIDGVDTLAKNTEFNDVKLLCEKGSMDMPVGGEIGEKVEIPKYDLTASALELKDSTGKIKIDLNDIDGSLKKIDGAMDKVLSAQSKYGALENRFESNYDNLIEISHKAIGAESSIRDADIAEEMMEFSKNSILVEAGNAMMVQSNKFPQDVLRILENVKSR